MKINEWIALLSCVGTLGATLTVVFTLYEMKIQRKSSYKPDVVLLDTEFYSYNRKNGHKYLPSLWSTRRIVFSDDTKYEDIKRQIGGISLCNIGVGPAKKVEVEWEFDHDRLIQTIKEKDTNNIFKIEEYEKNLQNQYSMIEGDEWTGLNVYQFRKTKKEFLLNYDTSSDIFEVNISRHFRYLVSIVWYLYLEDYSDPVALYNFLMPELYIKLSYSDIGGNRYKKIYRCNFDLFSLLGGYNETDYLKMIEGVLEFDNIY